MRVSVDFGGRFWKAEHLLKPVLLTIKSVSQEAMMGDTRDMKWVLWFEEDARGLVLNQTNAKIIDSLYGDDSDVWKEKQIVLFKSNTEMQGRIVDCVRVREPKNKQAPPPDDQIPF
jgi:hypothetical protein